MPCYLDRFGGVLSAAAYTIRLMPNIPSKCYSFSSGFSYVQAALPFLLFFFFSLSWLVALACPCRAPEEDGVPVYGYRSLLEPTFVLRARFAFGARSLIRAGRSHIKDRPFLLRRWCPDVMVLPIKYLEELRLKPGSQLSLVEAQAV
ncbi:hypothetical protein L249_1274, partial [Ophiocordyceps polyrhachis-furcata BCC 54312]